MFFKLTSKEVRKTVYFKTLDEANGFVKGLQQLLPATHKMEFWTGKKYGESSVLVALLISPADSN